MRTLLPPSLLQQTPRRCRHTPPAPGADHRRPSRDRPATQLTFGALEPLDTRYWTAGALVRLPPVSTTNVRQYPWRRMRLLDRVIGTELFRSFAMGRRLAVRATSGPARIWILLCGLLFGTQRWKHPLVVWLDGPQGRVRFCVPDYSAFKVLHEVFVLEEYAIDLSPPPQQIIDVGAHIGASVLYFKRRWPEVKVLAIEASPSLVPVLEQNVRRLAGIEIRHAAVAEERGYIIFYESDSSWGGSLTRGWGGSLTGEAHRAVTVPATTLDDLLDVPVDIVKLDIEGGEFGALGAATRLDRARAVIGELHALPEAPEVERILRLFDSCEVVAAPAKEATLFQAVRYADPDARSH